MGCSRDSIRRNIESSGSISVMAIRSLGPLPGVPSSRWSTKLLALTSLIGDSDKTLPPRFRQESDIPVDERLFGSKHLTAIRG